MAIPRRKALIQLHLKKKEHEFNINIGMFEGTLFFLHHLGVVSFGQDYSFPEALSGCGEDVALKAAISCGPTP